MRKNEKKNGKKQKNKNKKIIKKKKWKEKRKKRREITKKGRETRFPRRASKWTASVSRVPTFCTTTIVKKNAGKNPHMRTRSLRDYRTGPLPVTSLMVAHAHAITSSSTTSSNMTWAVPIYYWHASENILSDTQGIRLLSFQPDAKSRKQKLVLIQINSVLASHGQLSQLKKVKTIWHYYYYYQFLFSSILNTEWNQIHRYSHC
jgi:hypothetical protein